MLTFVDKIVYKHSNNMELTKAEKYFFSVKDILNIIRCLKPKRDVYKRQTWHLVIELYILLYGRILLEIV